MSGPRNHTGHRVGEWHQNAKVGDAKVREARLLRADGWTYGSISERLGVPYFTVRDWVTLRTRSTA